MDIYRAPKTGKMQYFDYRKKLINLYPHLDMFGGQY